MKALMKKFERMMTAVTFAEAGEFDTAREEMKATDEDKIEITHLRLKKFSTMQAETMEAVTFAEAGEQEYAKTIIEESVKANDTMLVVGDEKFSKALMDYSINMARRMELDIIAINVISIKKEMVNLISEQRKEQFIESANQFADEFSKEAASKGIEFKHEVHFGKSEAVIKQVSDENKKVTFVLTEPEGVCDTESCKASIPVYCIS